MRRREDFLDLMKGIGIILVVWGHLDNPIPHIIYSFHIPLFFFISGSLYNISNITKLKERSISYCRILFFYFLLSYLIFGLVNLIRDTNFQINSITQIVDGSELYRYNVPLWFLLCLTEITILYYFISKVKKRYIVFLICFALSFTGFLLNYYKLNIPYHIDSAFSMLIFYFLGHNVYNSQIHIKINSLAKWKVIIGIITFLFLFIYLNMKLTPFIDIRINKIDINFIYYLLIALLGVIVVFVFSVKAQKIQAINFFGRSSIIIFCTHNIIKGFLTLLPLSWFQNEMLLGIMELFFILIISSIAIWALNKEVFQKYRYLFGLK